MGEREGEGLVGRPRRPGGGLEVLVAAGVDELEIADQARDFALRNVRSGPCARPRLGFPEL